MIPVNVQMARYFEQSRGASDLTREQILDVILSGREEVRLAHLTEGRGADLVRGLDLGNQPNVRYYETLWKLRELLRDNRLEDLRSAGMDWSRVRIANYTQRSDVTTCLKDDEERRYLVGVRRRSQTIGDLTFELGPIRGWDARYCGRLFPEFGETELLSAVLDGCPADTYLEDILAAL